MWILKAPIQMKSPVHRQFTLSSKQKKPKKIVWSPKKCISKPLKVCGQKFGVWRAPYKS